MFVPCPHCQFLVACPPHRREFLPADCPRCGRSLEEEPAAEAPPETRTMPLPAPVPTASTARANETLPTQTSAQAAMLRALGTTHPEQREEPSPPPAPAPVAKVEATDGAVSASTDDADARAGTNATGYAAASDSDDPVQTGTPVPDPATDMVAGSANTTVADPVPVTDPGFEPEPDQEPAPAPDPQPETGTSIETGPELQPEAGPATESGSGPEPAPVQPEILPAGQAAAPAFAAVARATAWRRLRWPLVALLALLLGLQALVADRARLAADPGWRPLLESLCGTLGCSLPPWREPDAFTMLDRQVRPAPRDGTLAVEATFRNDARWAQDWPALQLALSDADGQVLGSAVFTPEQYLGVAPTTRLAPGQSAQVGFLVQEPAPGTVAFSFEFR